MASNFSHQIAFLLSITLLLFVNISSMNPLCHNDERSALLQFKQSFVIDTYASRDPSSYPKVESWNSSNCCMWDGVECDEVSGHVIGLDLSSNCLYGSFNSNSNLFHLSHLEMLNLGDNNFTFSLIPPKIASLSNLIYLNLSYSVFSGQIPMEISKLSNLVSLDLRGTHLSLVDFKRLVQNLTRLQTLDLSGVNISSSLPDVFMNLPSLSSLSLFECNVTGAMPSSLGQLTKLAYLDLFNNSFSGQVPFSLGELTKLAHLDLSYNNFSSQVPFSFGKLTKLAYLDLSHNNFSSQVPFSFGKLTKLAFLDLSQNSFSSQVPFSFGKLTKLAFLNVGRNSFSGEVPSSLENLTELIELHLSFNNFSEGGLSWLGKQTKLKYLYLQNMNLVGEIPSCLKNLTYLQYLHLGDNKLTGPIPESISQFVSLQSLNLQFNNLSGMTRFEMFMRIKHLTFLHIDGNSLTLLTNFSSNYTFPQFEHLGLGDCNLRKVPDFIRHQNRLTYLDLTGNNIEGHVPRWIGNVGNEGLIFLDLSHNSFSGFEQPSSFLLSKNLAHLDLSFNKLQGPLPLPPNSIEQYDVSSNKFTEEISTWFCKLRSLTYLNVSDNNMHGIIPKCLLNFTDTLVILSLANNHLNGNIPDTFGNRNVLRMIDISHNQLEGNLPRSLANCRVLEFLDVSANQIHDNFPVWLGSLPNLEVMILRSNHFFGSLKNPNVAFPKLRILDLSHNEFFGIIPTGFFQIFNNMNAPNLDEVAYMKASLKDIKGTSETIVKNSIYQIVMANKGISLKYWEIPKALAAIDFSSNKFQGGIPDSLATLNMINVLSLSNNHLSGHIPSILRNLTNLESLDLSSNNFSGKIPQQLVDLTFLEYFNVSNNQLMGSIPQGQQFNTFDNTSYTGNTELCGPPLTRKCGNFVPTAQPLNGRSKLPIDVGWKSAAVGYGSGIVVGVVSGLVFYKRHQTWLLYTFGRWPAQRSSRRRRGRRAVH